MRLRAAREVGITHVPFVPLDLESEPAGVEYVMKAQAKRRSTNDGERYRLCERFDRLNARGGDLRNPPAKSKRTRVLLDPEQGNWADMIAKSLGCNFRKVERIRKIRKDGTPEIQWAVRTGRMSINRAYTLIGQMEKGKANSAANPAQVSGKEVEILFADETVTILKELGGDLGADVIKAIDGRAARDPAL